jgi:hypothetical protein
MKYFYVVFTTPFTGPIPVWHRSVNHPLSKKGMAERINSLRSLLVQQSQNLELSKLPDAAFVLTYCQELSEAIAKEHWPEDFENDITFNSILT